MDELKALQIVESLASAGIAEMPWKWSDAPIWKGQQYSGEEDAIEALDMFTRFIQNRKESG